MYRTTAEAAAAAEREQRARQCATGRHVITCPHRAPVAS